MSSRMQADRKTAGSKNTGVAGNRTGAGPVATDRGGGGEGGGDDAAGDDVVREPCGR